MRRLFPVLLAAIIPAVSATLPGSTQPALKPTQPVSKVTAAVAAPVKATADTYTTPSTAIIAPTGVKRGQLVVIDVKPFDKPEGLNQYTYVWIVSPKVGGVIPWPDGTKLVFGSGTDDDPSHYDVTLVANYLYTDKDGKNPVLKTVETTAAIDITTPKPPPGPEPPPDPPKPPPAPVVPDGVYKIAPAVYELAKLHPAAECQALAKTYRTLSESPVTTKAELANLTFPALKLALGSSYPAWTADLKSLADKVNALNVVPIADCRVLFGEIASGFEAVK